MARNDRQKPTHIFLWQKYIKKNISFGEREFCMNSGDGVLAQ